MALQLGALRDALIEAGASPSKADKASEELAGYEDRLGSIELKVEKLTGEVNALRAEMKGEFSAVRSEMKGESSAVRGEMRGGFQAQEGKIEGLRSEIRVFSVVTGLILSVMYVILSIIAAGFWHSLPPAH